MLRVRPCLWLASAESTSNNPSPQHLASGTGQRGGVLVLGSQGRGEGACCAAMGMPRQCLGRGDSRVISHWLQAAQVWGWTPAVRAFLLYPQRGSREEGEEVHGSERAWEREGVLPAFGQWHGLLHKVGT